jgi:glycosyltransferase involved in cell wall biosynthesis
MNSGNGIDHPFRFFARRVGDGGTPPARPVALLLGPHRHAASGLSTHIDLLFGTRLAREFTLLHFQTGSEGRGESARGRYGRLLRSPFQLAAGILRRGAGLVHINTSLDAGAYWRDLAYLLVAKICGARVVYQMHGGALPQQMFRGSAVLTAFLRATLKLPDVIVVITQSELDAYRKFCPGRPLVLIPNGIDCGPYPDCERAQAGAGAALRLVYADRLVRGKGLFESLEALRLALVHGVSAQLIIAGGGPEELHFRRRVEELGIAAHVSFVGAVSGQKKVDLFRSSDVFLLPSDSEGAPHALLEAMAAGLPAIATRVGAIPDIMADGVHGVFVPCHDSVAISAAILKLSDRTRLMRMSAACRDRIAAAYSIERAADSFCSLYAQLFALKAAGSLQRP